MKNIIQLTTMVFLLVFQSITFAESSKVLGNFIVHYNVISSESMPPVVERSYGITRSKNKSLLIINVLKKGKGFIGVEADIEVSAINSTGQLRDIKLRKIEEKNAIYYISVLSEVDREILDFSIKVTTTDKQTANIKLSQQFFVD